MRSVRGGVAGASRGICGVGYGRRMGGECLVFAGVAGPSVRGGVARASCGICMYLRVWRRAVFAGYGRCMGGECVVFAGWPAAEASRGRRAVFAGSGMGGVWAGNAWYLRGGRPTEGERSRRRRRRVGSRGICGE